MALNVLFEVSSEAARNVGPVYAVLRGKAPLLSKKLKDNYVLFGIYDPSSAAEFQSQAPPAEWARTFNELRPQGIDCYHGRWPGAGNTRMVLIDARRYGERMVEYEVEGGKKRGSQLQAIKDEVWKTHGIDSAMMGGDFNDSIVWSRAVGVLLELLSNQASLKGKRVVVNFHDWSSGAALLHLKSRNLPFATVYTTHNTVLGHALASTGRDILTEAKGAGERKVDLHEAYNLKVEGKHLLELACAQEADVFCASSGTVALEAPFILGKSPDMVTMDGLAPEQFRPRGKGGRLTRYAREELEEFAESYFAPYYDFDVRDALFVFLVGRYEYRSKGFDLYVKALGRLNDALKLESGKARPVVAFLFAPSNVSGPKSSVLHNYLLLDKVHELVRATEGESIAALPIKELLRKCSPATASKVRAMIESLKREGEMPPTTCYGLNYQNDAVENATRVAGVDNSADDLVKFIFYPTYLRPGDGLLDMDYQDILWGMDVGVFPARYEPFGHASVEAASNNSVVLLSDATGFGLHLSNKVKGLGGRGARVVPLVGRSDEEVANAFASELRSLCITPPRKLAALKQDAFKLAHTLDWAALLPDHLAAYELALQRHPVSK